MTLTERQRENIVIGVACAILMMVLLFAAQTEQGVFRDGVQPVITEEVAP